MRDIIKIVVDADHYLRCPVDTIARDGEGNVTVLEITFPEKLSSYWVYVDFKMPDGEKFKSPRLDVNGNTATYTVPPYVLVEGKLKMQVLFQNADGAIWKSYKKPFNVRPSINAVDDIPDKEDFIAEAQKVLDKIKEEGGFNITVDDALSMESVNPVQNKVVADRIVRLENGVSAAYTVASNAQDAANLAGDAAFRAEGNINYKVLPRLDAAEADIANLKENGTATGDAVLYTPQTLTEEQQAQARKNIGAGTGGAVGAVRYDVGNQGLNALEQGNARYNIDAAQSAIIFTVTGDGLGYTTDMSWDLLYNAYTLDKTRTILCNYDGLLLSAMHPFVNGSAAPFVFAGTWQDGVYLKVQITREGVVEVTNEDWIGWVVDYTDEKVGDIDAALDSIIAIQQSLIGGDA